MTQSIPSSIRTNTKAAAIPEAAIVLSLLLPMLLGGMEIGLMMWTRGTLQSVAAMTARCAAIGSSACTNPQQYAVDLSKTWLGSGVIAGTLKTSNVTVASATTCKSASGSFKVVTIVASPWVGAILYPDAARTDTLVACYPT